MNYRLIKLVSVAKVFASIGSGFELASTQHYFSRLGYFEQLIAELVSLWSILPKFSHKPQDYIKTKILRILLQNFPSIPQYSQYSINSHSLIGDMSRLSEHFHDLFVLHDIIIQRILHIFLKLMYCA